MKQILTLTQREQNLGWLYWGIELFVLPNVLELINTLFPNPAGAAVLNFWFFLINFIAVTVIFRRILRRSVFIAKSRPWWMLQSAALGFFAYELSVPVVSNLLTLLYPAYFNINDTNFALMVEEYYALMAIGIVFLVPVTEECLFRGLIFGGFYPKNKAAAYILSAAAFSAIHIVGYLDLYEPMLLFLCSLQYLPAGFFLAWAYARSGTLLAPVLIHMSINAMGILALR